MYTAFFESGTSDECPTGAGRAGFLSEHFNIAYYLLIRPYSRLKACFHKSSEALIILHSLCRLFHHFVAALSVLSEFRKTKQEVHNSLVREKKEIILSNS